MLGYEGLKCLYGDLHNHCGISYGHGTIQEAFQNARERLDFCSVTGHAFWPDIPEPDARTRHLVDYHNAGFARLREGWEHVKAATRAWHKEGEFVTFLGFEMHSRRYGDHTVLYCGDEGDILYCDGLPELRVRMRELKARGVAAIAFPHHIAYRRGFRGIDWDAFTPEFSPVVEIMSMHGCSEADEGVRPFLHSMGPSDHEGTMRYGLASGHVFGVIGSTDHHSAHPGSYGHGLTGVWAEAKTRRAVWEALLARRTCALTGDRIKLRFALNGHPMGAQIARSPERRIDVEVKAGGAIDCVDIIRNGRLLRRFSQCDLPERHTHQGAIRTLLYLELGWGERHKAVQWDVRMGITDGEILSVEPRFRGREVLAPTDAPDGEHEPNYYSHWEPAGARAVRVQTVTFGNPTNTTPGTQGICLEVRMPPEGAIALSMNGAEVSVPLERALAGACAGYLGDVAVPAYRLHRAPRPWEFEWKLSHVDRRPSSDGPDTYYVRVRQKSGQMAWSSPIFMA